MLSKIKKNKSLKTLIENFLSLSALQLLTMFLPVITLPYILKTIGIERYGSIIMATTFINYFITLSDYSFGITGTRDVASHRHSKKSLEYIYGKVMSTQVFILIISAILIVLIVETVPQFRSERVVFYLTFLTLIGKTLFPDWFFQGMEKMKFITIFNVVIRLIFVAGVFLFIKKKEDYYLHPLLFGLGSLIAGLIAQYLLIFKFHLKLRIPNWGRIIENIKDNFGVFINQFLPQLYNNSTTFLLGLLAGNAIVGVFGTLKSVVEIASSILGTISRVFFPFLTRNFAYFNRFAVAIFTISCIFFIGIIVCSKSVINILHLKDINAIPIIIILAAGLPLLALYMCFGTNYFIVKRQDKLVVRNTIVASFLGFILAYPLILFLGGVGAAVNLTLSRGFMGVGLWYKYKKTSKKLTNEAAL